MNKLTARRRAQILSVLVEGNSVRSTCRITGAAKGTVLSPLEVAGAACRQYHNETVQGVITRRVQCDTIWSFCHNKERNTAPEHDGGFGFGDVWTWVALDADTKLALTWLVGGRSGETAYVFMQDTANRPAGRVQLTTDGLKSYLDAVDNAFGGEIDYAQLVKLYGTDPNAATEHRYSPPVCVETETNVVRGDPVRRTSRPARLNART